MRRDDYEIGGRTSGRQAMHVARESAISVTPAVENAREGGAGALAVARESATRAAPPHEDPGGDAGRTPAIPGSRAGATLVTPASEEPAPAAAGEKVHSSGEPRKMIDLFADQLTLEIAELWRLRQAMVTARRSTELRAQAWCRRVCGGDKTEAGALWKAARDIHAPPPRRALREHPGAEGAMGALTPHLLALDHYLAAEAAFGRELRKMARRLPIHDRATAIKGISADTLAAITGELGDLSAYEKGVAGVWKRAGLAVIDGERQRKKADAAAALRHGYSPSRRSVIWNVAAAVFKAQSGADPGPYRLIYDARKPHEAQRCATNAHAHNAALRYMSKRLLKDLWRIACGEGRS